MAQNKHQFYRNGTDTQKRADITVDLKRVDIKKMQQWTPEQKQWAKNFIKDAKVSFDAFVKEIESL